MRKIYSDDYYQQRNVYVAGKGPKQYGFMKFCFDCVMTLITSGLWLIWVFVREMRRR